ncbi:MAG: proteasome accessory factor PafA2 family protein [Candidatus Latescibacterota bacterium]
MGRLFGLETEYGIQVDGVGDVDVVVESMELVRCYLQADFVAMWDYGLENPRLDARGFEVQELRNDQDETVHLQRDRQRQIPLQELKSDLVIHNGARFYNDHTHPEYATPECRRLLDLVAADRAGERILLHCGQRRTALRGSGTVRLFKNNTDFQGHSYGCHENYLIDRATPFAAVIDGLLPFLATRSVFTGAGKVGVERERARGVRYQLSQRADFFDTVASIDTMHRRPLVNTRDEPHADPARYRRLHVITGDANMAEYATALKVGSMVLVLDLLELGELPSLALADPVGALKDVSRDASRRWLVELEGGRQTTALQIQQAILARARALLAGRDADTDWVLREWQHVLDHLPERSGELVGQLDWVTKEWLLGAFAEAEGLDWEDPDDQAWLQSQDLEYHNLDPQDGLFRLLESQGRTARLTDEEQVGRALIEPPADTRARFRGGCLEKFGGSIRALNWDSIEFGHNGAVEVLDLKHCIGPAESEAYVRALEAAATVDDLLVRLAGRSEVGRH